MKNETSSETFSGGAFAQLESSPKCAPQRRLTERTSFSFGMFMVSIFAPNHKAMPVLARNSQLDFMRRQLLTSRNVIAHPITDFWYGGLNYQIEHHLFPRLPRNKLREAQSIIKAFCGDQSIAYHETSVLQSYREILCGGLCLVAKS